MGNSKIFPSTHNDVIKIIIIYIFQATNQTANNRLIYHLASVTLLKTSVKVTYPNQLELHSTDKYLGIIMYEFIFLGFFSACHGDDLAIKLTKIARFVKPNFNGLDDKQICD